MPKPPRSRAIVRPGAGRPARSGGPKKVSTPTPPARKAAAKQAAKTATRDAAKRASASQRSLAHLRQRSPHLYMQVQRIGRLMEIQSRMKDDAFPPGCCFLHANVVTVSNFCVKQIKEINLETSQVTVDIHGDEHLEAGIVLLPLETIEWFGFPSTAVPIEIHFHGFTSAPGRRPNPALPATTDTGQTGDRAD